MPHQSLPSDFTEVGARPDRGICTDRGRKQRWERSKALYEAHEAADTALSLTDGMPREKAGQQNISDQAACSLDPPPRPAGKPLSQ